MVNIEFVILWHISKIGTGSVQLGTKIGESQNNDLFPSVAQNFSIYAIDWYYSYSNWTEPVPKLKIMEYLKFICLLYECPCVPFKTEVNTFIYENKKIYKKWKRKGRIETGKGKF